MLEYEDSPPPLHHSPSPSDQSQFTSRDTTPVTPVGSGPTFGKKTEKDCLPWFRKPISVGRTTTRLCLDTPLLEPDFDDSTFPTFGASPPARGMASAANPLDISTRQTSTSPRGNQPSNLTSALQRSDSEEKRKMANLHPETALNRPIPQMPSNASDDFAKFERGARPISMKGTSNDRQARRESIAQSLNAGMSWGGISVGSWIRDDMMMSGTSPFTFNSPSFHSSSYLPKLEANFMKDFSCCGLTLPTLHDLLQHYEESHAQKDPMHGGNNQQPMPDSRAAIAATTAAQVQQEAQQRSQQQPSQNAPGRPFGSQPATAQNTQRQSGFSSTLQTIPDMDTVEDMEMDDIDGADETTPPPNLYTQHQSQASPQASFNASAQPQVPQLNTTMMQGHQAYRQSTPTTPVTSGRSSAPFQGNNASSTLMANPMQQFQDLQNAYRGTPDSSAPGTPGELDDGLMDGMDDMSMSNNNLFNGLPNGFGNFGFGMNNDMIDLCIDEPAKRLFSHGNQGMQGQNVIHSRLGSGQYGPDSDIARTIRERQAAAGLPDTTTNIPPHEEPKPFRCPVIGCEKAYKNQNGLKYHKAHGHNNQRLHENGDGTFSIVDPDTQAPYPGTMGMEKEKPYKCDVCQKRYKNLNGLKYHKTHSPPCNPELQLNANKNSPLGMTNMMGGHNAGNMGAGLQGDLSMM